MKLSSHEAGESCHCKRLKCFENITESERKQLLSTFNAMSDNNEENAYLCSLISLMVIQRRRNRNPEEETAYHDSTYSYRVRIKRDNKVVASELYDICPTLINHLKNRKCGPVGRPTILTQEEEQHIVRILMTLAEWGFGMDRFQLKILVQDYLKRIDRPNPFKNGIPGKGLDYWI
ncbi:hypothetical protein QE152_g27251 [Popillia japonica]|uniref:Uncharacterized protein n=1 Tax=Popillia japonica TaxID=7064 RepID=A0AAW1JVI2_POPJA